MYLPLGKHPILLTYNIKSTPTHDLEKAQSTTINKLLSCFRQVLVFSTHSSTLLVNWSKILNFGTIMNPSHVAKASWCALQWVLIKAVTLCFKRFDNTWQQPIIKVDPFVAKATSWLVFHCNFVPEVHCYKVHIFLRRILNC